MDLAVCNTQQSMPCAGLGCTGMYTLIYQGHACERPAARCLITNLQAHKMLCPSWLMPRQATTSHDVTVILSDEEVEEPTRRKRQHVEGQAGTRIAHVRPPPRTANAACHTTKPSAALPEQQPASVRRLASTHPAAAAHVLTAQPHPNTHPHLRIPSSASAPAHPHAHTLSPVPEPSIVQPGLELPVAAEPASHAPPAAHTGQHTLDSEPDSGSDADLSQPESPPQEHTPAAEMTYDAAGYADFAAEPAGGSMTLADHEPWSSLPISASGFKVGRCCTCDSLYL